jgi:UDP-N-acetylglucosamine 2-epimerase (non-hydrolysing)
MAILIKKLNASPLIEHRLCSAGQHREMLQQVLDFFQIRPDYELSVMAPNQGLTALTSRIMLGVSEVLDEFNPDWVLVHGDTTTCLAATLASFFAGIKVGHVEAGLRTGNLKAPFPEEANRVLTDRLARVFFAPTVINKELLLAEKVNEDRVWITGNTVIDALLWTRDQVSDFTQQVPLILKEACANNRKILLVTGHRRENFGRGFEEICGALATLATELPDLLIAYPVHPNPNVRGPVYEYLSGFSNVCLLEPLEYPDFVFLLEKCWAILTDSGGIQEEAPALGKVVFVMRETTERPEAVQTGAVRLVGANQKRIVEAVLDFWQDPYEVAKSSPYGDGKASERILEFFEKQSLTMQ